MIYKMFYKVQKLGDAHELQKEIPRANQEGVGRKRAMTGPLPPQTKPDQ